MNERFQHSIKVPRLYKQAAKILKEANKGENLKELLYSPTKPLHNVKALYALIHESLRHRLVLDVLIEKSSILVKEEKLDPWLARILLTELLWGKKHLGGDSKPIKTVLSYKHILLNILNLPEVCGIKNERNDSDQLPRFARINTLKMSVDDVLAYFKSEGWQQIYSDAKSYDAYIKALLEIKAQHFIQDFHIKEVLAFPPGTVFYENELYINGILLLQNKASCFPSHLLSPKPGSIVLDMCAAPGMKTSHMAAIMGNKGKIYAVERNNKRFKMLRNMMEKAGAACVESLHSDCTSITSETCPGVEYILVDPSCSGSGIVNRMEIGSPKMSDESRLQRLTKFQTKLLYHAVTNFPCVKRIVYSTCSVNVLENEAVVEKVMSYLETDTKLKVKFQVSMALPPESWNNFGSDAYNCGPFCIYSLPDKDLTTGFFVAVLDRVPNPYSSDTILLRNVKTKCYENKVNSKCIKQKRRKFSNPVEES